MPVHRRCRPHPSGGTGPPGRPLGPRRPPGGTGCPGIHRREHGFNRDNGVREPVQRGLFIVSRLALCGNLLVIPAGPDIRKFPGHLFGHPGARAQLRRCSAPAGVPFIRFIRCHIRINRLFTRVGFRPGRGYGAFRTGPQPAVHRFNRHRYGNRVRHRLYDRDWYRNEYRNRNGYRNEYRNRYRHRDGVNRVRFSCTPHGEPDGFRYPCFRHCSCPDGRGHLFHDPGEWPGGLTGRNRPAVSTGRPA
jgi:hypothetical protein